jgi:hypothetical protein
MTKAGAKSRRCGLSGARHRRKGNRVERAVVRALQTRGFAAERVPLSGAANGRFGGDVSIPLLGRDRRIEVKARCNGFRRLYDWLGDRDFLVLKADRREPLVVLPLSLSTEIFAVAERNNQFGSSTHLPSVLDPPPFGRQKKGEYTWLKNLIKQNRTW